ncbi:Isoquinoline 1-oxidoreductase subunit [Paracoccus salsus]|uniref:Isoquinoline 1-oxidoreductase subunit n=1 Tax=Paracoccus salsus TaxID=2911061 RepID=UPI001F2E2817|nr:Isoquinoline 1-oxidoreductase subunit [Paracoccus salsus]MCF3972128.1 Isoquinoline 1-oxidoreductase subunit [Paracoccus salsus]
MIRLVLTSVLAVTLCLPATAQDTGSSSGVSPVQGLRPVSDFDDIADDDARSIAIFEEMGKVLTHPRCLNCHPKGDSPLQGDEMMPHMPPVIRGDADFGAPGMTCNTCHGAENYEIVGAGGIESVPGHTPWSLAPIEMAWVGQSVAEICEQLKDPARNGDRSLDEIHEHMAKDGLVGWGWHPGAGRMPAPGSQAAFGELTRAWIDTGAACPA